jgi:hypothetical protein
MYRIGQTGDRPLAEPLPNRTPIGEALRYGITAPSPHNSQPWRIELTSPTEARLLFDPRRHLPEADPPGRQGHIGHGTLIEMTSIAATSQGYRCEVEVLPEGEMAVSEFGTKPTAILRMVPEPRLPVDPLFSHVLARRCSRLPHQGPPLGVEEKRQIEEQARIDGVEVGWVSSDRFASVLDIAARAMTIEVNDYAVFDETLKWFRFSDREIKEKGDGLDLDTAGLSGIPLALARAFTRPGNWHQGYNRGPYLRAFVDSVHTTRALLTLTTSTNSTQDWIAAGRSYMRAELAGNGLGCRFQPISQSLQEYRQMDGIRIEMENLMGVTAPAKLQMLVRVGRTSQPALSPRRELGSILKESSGSVSKQY